MNTLIEKLYRLKENMPDLVIKEINDNIKDTIYIASLQTVSSLDKANEFILNFFKDKRIFDKSSKNNLDEEIKNYIPALNYLEIKERDVIKYLLNGFTIVIYKDSISGYETKASLDRSISEPTSEPVVKGPKDSFNENYTSNIGLIRKRIKNENLYLKEYTKGNKTETRIGLLYLNDIVDKELLKNATSKIEAINADKVLDSYYITDLLKKENKTLFTTIISTEKPDEVAKAITEGRIALVCENGPNVIIIPTYFLDFFHINEDVYHMPFFSRFVKVIRILAFFIAIITPGLFLAVTTYEQQILPTSLLMNFAMQRSMVPFPSIIEAILLIIIFEILYEGDARTPSSRGSTLSILGALVLGDAAVQAGIVSTIMVIVIALTAISSLIFAFYDFQAAIRFYRYFIMFLSAIFGILGFFIAVCFMLINMCSIKSFGKPYLNPIAPYLGKLKRKTKIKRALLEENIEKE